MSGLSAAFRGQSALEGVVACAVRARAQAYAPYSNFPVGAALLTPGGAVYVGVNVENAAYPVGMCAERNALGAAVSNGAREFVGLAVVAAGGPSPCGACRQALLEFGDMMVWMCTPDGTMAREAVQLSGLLPWVFGPEVRK